MGSPSSKVGKIHSTDNSIVCAQTLPGHTLMATEDQPKSQSSLATGRVPILQTRNKETKRFKTTLQDKFDDHDMEMDIDTEMNECDADASQPPANPLTSFIDSRRLISFQGPGFYCTANGLFFDPKLWHHLDSDTNPSYRIMLKPEFEHQSSDLARDMLSANDDPAVLQKFAQGSGRIKDPEGWDYYNVKFVEKAVHLIPMWEIPDPSWNEAAGSCGGPVSTVQICTDSEDWQNQKLNKSLLELGWGRNDATRADAYAGIFYDKEEEGCECDSEVAPLSEEVDLRMKAQNVCEMINELAPCMDILSSDWKELSAIEGGEASAPAHRLTTLERRQRRIDEQQDFCAKIARILSQVQTKIRLWQEELKPKSVWEMKKQDFLGQPGRGVKYQKDLR